jgi:serine/threonine protein kinase
MKDVPSETVASILNDPPAPIDDERYSKELKNLVNSLLTKDPEHRPSI